MKTLLILPGDGVGPEVTAAAVAVLQAVATTFGHEWEFPEYAIGGCAMDAGREPLPPETLEACRAADGILLGAVGGPRWSDPRAKVRPEQGLLELRKQLGLFANLRPLQLHASQAAASPLRPELLRGVDILFVRELTGGLYFGAKRLEGDTAIDECVYSVQEVERVVRIAARCAMERKRMLTSVDKANVLETSRLWRATTERVIEQEFPEVELEHILVDAMAMHLLTRPSDFDVVVTENMFGDILTDESSVLAGSLGLLPSASIGASGPGVFEPIHGSAPDIAGQGIANPYGAILSAALLLRHSLGFEAEAQAIERAVERALAEGVQTPDLVSGKSETTTALVTARVVALLVEDEDLDVAELAGVTLGLQGDRPVGE